jgi:response regulator RpfG family c-di-GMP phosphodiesterase
MQDGNSTSRYAYQMVVAPSYIAYEDRKTREPGCMGQNGARKRALAVVLVVESNTRRRRATAADLRHEGFEVYEAANSAEAKGILSATVVDAVFSDVDLIDAAELSQWVEQRRPSTHLIWTASTESEPTALLH